MRAFLFFILIILFSFICCLYFPWWSIAVVAFGLTCLIPQKPASAFFWSFTAVFLFWLVFSFVLSFQNEHILAGRASALILNIGNPWIFILLTALIGGLVSGMSSLTASWLFWPQKPSQVVEDLASEDGHQYAQTPL